ncbi:MAG TPA: DNA methyltransferase [bacterium]|nr:DNA methyltransferase [bacterium]
MKSQPLISIFGNHPALSLAELLSRYELQANAVLTVTDQGACFHGSKLVRIDDLGGTMKIAGFLFRLPAPYTEDQITDALADYLVSNCADRKEIVFAVSYHDNAGEPLDSKYICQGIKQRLKGKLSAKIRYILPGEGPALSTAQVAYNQLAQADVSHSEFVLLPSGTETLIGRTEAIQDIAAYVARDENRPHRISSEGMMPLKLAQILINLATPASMAQKSTGLLVDPFCGSGTILQEALRLGYDVFGSDLSNQAIKTSDSNIRWFLKHHGKKLTTRAQFLAYDARKIHEALGDESTDVVVSEGYLGTMFSRHPTKTQLEQETDAHVSLYRSAFTSIYRILKPGGRLVMTLPYYLEKRVSIYEQLLDALQQIGYNQKSLLPDSILSTSPAYRNQLTGLQTCIYHRPSQIVGREIISLTKSA